MVGSWTEIQIMGDDQAPALNKSKEVWSLTVGLNSLCRPSQGDPPQACVVGSQACDRNNYEASSRAFPHPFVLPTLPMCELMAEGCLFRGTGSSRGLRGRCGGTGPRCRLLSDLASRRCGGSIISPSRPCTLVLIPAIAPMRSKLASPVDRSWATASAHVCMCCRASVVNETARFPT